MNKLSVVAAALVLLGGLSSSALAASKHSNNSSNNTQLGLGVSFGAINAVNGGGSFDASTVYLPINANNKLWFEPFFLYGKDSPDTGGSSSILGLGAGVFSNINETRNTRAYIGGRLGLARVSPAGGDSSTLVEVAPTIGFGYLPVDNIMFGAEASFALLNSDAGTSFGTQTGLFARYFFK